MAAVLLGISLFVIPSAYGYDLEAVWTGNKATDYSVWPKESFGRPKDDIFTPNTDLPNDEGRQGGSPIIYGQQIICDGTYNGVSRIDMTVFVKDGEGDAVETVSAGDCQESGGQTICNNVSVYDYSVDIDDNILSIDPVFENGVCAVRDERRAPNDEIENKQLICDNIVLPEECELKDVIGFMPLTQWEGVGEGTWQDIWFPEPPGRATYNRGDFVLEVDLAMEDMEEVGGYYYQGIGFRPISNDRDWSILYVNWGGAPDQYFHNRRAAYGTDLTSDALVGWDPLMNAPGHGNLTLRMEMVNEFLTASYKVPGSTWRTLFTDDFGERPDIPLEEGYRIFVLNGGSTLGATLTGNIQWVDEIRASLTITPEPNITLDDDVGLHGGSLSADLRQEKYPAHWIMRGSDLGWIYEPTRDKQLWATAEGYDQAAAGLPYDVGDLIPQDLTDSMVVTAWGTRDPSDVVTVVGDGRNAQGEVDNAILDRFKEEWFSFPDEYTIAFNVTDSFGQSAQELIRKVIVYEEGQDWALYNGHWYKMNRRVPYVQHQADARELGGYVTTINDEAENSFLADIFVGLTAEREYDQWWWSVIFGYTDLIVNGVYQWDNGEETDWLGWDTTGLGEPNNYDAGGNLGEEHYGAMAMGPSWGWVAPGVWIDIHDDHCCPFTSGWPWVPDRFDENSPLRHRPAWIEVETDPVPPVILLEGPPIMAMELGGTYTDPGVTAWDNVDGEVSGAAITIDSKLNVDVPTGLEPYTISYTATDAAGNTSSAVTRKVYVNFGPDEVPPEITLKDLSAAGNECLDPCMNRLDLGDTYEDNFSVFDNVDFDLVDVVATTYSLAAVRNAANEATTLFFAACEFGAGCLNEVELGAAVAGSGAVVVDGLAVSWHNLVQSDASPNAKLVWEKDETKSFVLGAGDVVNTVDTADTGLYVTKYTSQDTAGNDTPIQNRLIHVEDTPPTIELEGGAGLGLTIGEEYEEYGVEVTDAEDCGLKSGQPIPCTDLDALPNTIMDNVVITGSVDSNTLGDYTLTYVVTDSVGNKSETLTRTVSVVGETASPVQEKSPEEIDDFGTIGGSGCFIGVLFAD